MDEENEFTTNDNHYVNENVRYSARNFIRPDNLVVILFLMHLTNTL